MTTSVVPLLTAVWERLSASVDVQTLGAEVYDEVPESVEFPYVSFGEVDELPADQHDAQGLDVSLTLHVWSKYRGYKQAAEIVTALHRELDRKPLVVAGFKNVSVAAQSARYTRDPDPEIRHGIAPFRVWLTVDTTP